MIPLNFRRYIGDKAFYRRLVILLIPLALQSTLSSVVNLLDNVMVGRLTTESLSAVAIVNQLMFVFNITIFGAMAGASIFGAQYHGHGSPEGVRYTFRFRLILSVVLSLVGICVFLTLGDRLIQLYLHQEASSSGDLDYAFSEAKAYLAICLWGVIPFAAANSLSSTLRDTGETVTPMLAGVVAIVTNAFLNWVLIFGHFGLPAMGVRGAALATVISRWVEVAVLFIRPLRSLEKYPFLRGAFRSLYVPWEVIRPILVTGWPLLANEFLWSISSALLNQSYATRGLDAVAATNICGTVWQLFAIVMMSMGSAISILVGQQLGSGNKELARDTAGKLMFVNVAASIVMGLLMASVSSLIPQIYNVNEHVRYITSKMLIIVGIMLPVDAATHAAYFIMRSGGKTLLTFMFDCGFSWVVSFTLAFCLSRFTALDIVWIYTIVQLANFFKCGVGLLIVRSGVWLNTIVHDLKAHE